MKEALFLFSLTLSFFAASCDDSSIMTVQNSEGQLSSNAVLKASGNGLLLYYPFNGNANDESGHNHHGQVSGATLVADRFGAPNKAYWFNGTSSYINAGQDTALNPRTGMAVSVWIKYNGGFGSRDIITRWDVVYGRDERTYALNINASNRLGFWISPDGTHASAITAFDPNLLSVTGTWLHIVATWDGTVMRLYKNAREVAKMEVCAIKSSVNNRTSIGATLGMAGDPTISFFDGAIDDLRFYNRGLTSGEIQDLYTTASATTAAAKD